MIMTLGKVHSAAIEVHNFGDEDRQYNISAAIDTVNGKTTNLHNGVIADIETNTHLASFVTQNGTDGLQITYMTTTADRVSILRDLEEFIAVTTSKEITIIAE